MRQDAAFLLWQKQAGVTVSFAIRHFPTTLALAPHRRAGRSLSTARFLAPSSACSPSSASTLAASGPSGSAPARSWSSPSSPRCVTCVENIHDYTQFVWSTKRVPPHRSRFLALTHPLLSMMTTRPRCSAFSTSRASPQTLTLAAKTSCKRRFATPAWRSTTTFLWWAALRKSGAP